MIEAVEQLREPERVFREHGKLERPDHLLHNLVHVLFGVMGIAAFAGLFAPRLYAQIVAISYGLLVILGLPPATNTLFGLVPIYGNDVWLHLALGAIAAFFGFTAPAPVAATQE